MSDQLHNILSIIIKSVNNIKLKGNCLKGFNIFYNSAVEFLQDLKSDLGNELKKIKHDVAYLSDIFEVYNIKYISNCKEMKLTSSQLNHSSVLVWQS